MLNITCERCEKPFEIGEDHADEKATCPNCGNVHRVPERAPAPADELPPEEGPEVRIRIVRRTMFRAHPFRYTFITLLFLGGIALMILAPAMEQLPTWLAAAGLAVALTAAVWWFCWWLMAKWWVRLTLTNKRTIRNEGIIRRHTSEVLHDHVRNVSIKQTFMQRICRVGYLGIASAGQKGIEIEVHDIPRPDEVKAIIDQYRKM